MKIILIDYFVQYICYGQSGKLFIVIKCLDNVHKASF